MNERNNNRNLCSCVMYLWATYYNNVFILSIYCGVRKFRKIKNALKALYFIKNITANFNQLYYM